MSDELRERVARAMYGRWWRASRTNAPCFSELTGKALESELADADTAIALIWNEAMEEAAKVATAPSAMIDNEDSYARGYVKAAKHIAAAIRARKKP